MAGCHCQACQGGGAWMRVPHGTGLSTCGSCGVAWLRFACLRLQTCASRVSWGARCDVCIHVHLYTVVHTIYIYILSPLTPSLRTTSRMTQRRAGRARQRRAGRARPRHALDGRGRQPNPTERNGDRGRPVGWGRCRRLRRVTVRSTSTVRYDLKTSSTSTLAYVYVFQVPCVSCRHNP